MYKARESESTFIEVLIPKKQNVIIVSAYKHALMKPAEFIENYLEHFLQKTSYERKPIILTGDFNFDILKDKVYLRTADFLEALFCLQFPTQNITT